MEHGGQENFEFTLKKELIESFPRNFCCDSVVLAFLAHLLVDEMIWRHQPAPRWGIPGTYPPMGGGGVVSASPCYVPN